LSRSTPPAEAPHAGPEDLPSAETMTESALRDGIARFKWYSPIDFGGGAVARGDFNGSDLNSIDFGLGRWDFILRRNMPNLVGKRVLDIGCNSGIFSVEMARMGAAEVVGVDSSAAWPQWMEQASFVKAALEWRSKTRYPIRFVDADMATIPDLDLGRFDVAIALCCIYYLKDDPLQRLVDHLAANADTLILQGNTNRNDQTRDVLRRAHPDYLSRAVRRAGFPHVYVDRPLFYGRPCVVASHHPPPSLAALPRRDRLRLWLRRWV
jgi:SAM-dependent methyltransferase